MRAAEAGDLAEVKALLSAGVPALDPDPDGWTALHAAAVRCHPDVVRVLLETGAHVDVLDDYCFTPLLNAAGAGDGSSVGLLIEAGADINVTHPSYGWTPLSRAASYANVDVLALLLRAGADPHSDEPLNDAAESGCLACVELLIAAGARPRRSGLGQTPAQLARRQGHENIARLLDSLEPSARDM